MTINFLALNEIIEINEDMIKRYGGSFGIRDKGLLMSAMAQPQSSFLGQYLHKDIFEMGAAYLFHICNNHPFIDGNKRTAVTAAIMFFLLNDLKINVGNDFLVEMCVKVARGKLNKKEIANWFRKSAR